MANWVKNHKELIVFVLYAALAFSLLFYHENWRDEAQAWLLARDCTIPELIDAMKYEGHFLLWYFILMPFAKAGFPYFTTNIISWLIACIAVWLILRKAPFAFDKRVLLVFTFPLLYLYPVISRCYCLIPLAIVLMSIFYKNRKENPLRYLLSIVLLLNTHVIMAGMVAVVFIDYIIELYKRWKDLSEQEKQKTTVSIIIAVVLMLISIYPLLGCLTVNKEIQTGGNLTAQISQAVFHYPFVLLKGLFFIANSNELFYRVVLIISITALFLELRVNPLTCFKICLCILWQCLIYSSIIGPTFQRTSTVLFIILFFKWINTYKDLNTKFNLSAFQKKVRRMCLLSLLMLNIAGGLVFIKAYELPGNFSNAYEMAQYIDDYLDNHSIVLSGSHVEFISGIIPYIEHDIKFYHVPGKRYFSYAIWDNENKRNINLQDIKKLQTTFHNGDKLYYIFCTGKHYYHASSEESNLINKLLKEDVLEKLYCTNDASLLSENYVIYKVNYNKI